MVKHVIGQSNILFLSIENTKIGDQHNHCIALNEERSIELIIQQPPPPLKSAFARTNMHTNIKHQVQNCENYRKRMAFAYLSVVLFVLICKANRIYPEDCSATGVYSGTARNRDNMFYPNIEILPSPIVRWWSSVQTLLLGCFHRVDVFWNVKSKSFVAVWSNSGVAKEDRMLLLYKLG